MMKCKSCGREAHPYTPSGSDCKKCGGEIVEVVETAQIVV